MKSGPAHLAAPNFLQIFPNILSSFPSFWSSFSKDSFGGFVGFQGLTTRKELFSRFQIFRLSRPLHPPTKISREGQNETVFPFPRQSRVFPAFFRSRRETRRLVFFTSGPTSPDSDHQE
jgi:hypothetical protein